MKPEAESSSISTADFRTVSWQFDFENRPFRFIDLESGDTIKLNPSEVKAKYADIMKSKNEELLRHCYQYQIDYVNADINSLYDQVLTAYLLKREKLYKS